MRRRAVLAAALAVPAFACAAATAGAATWPDRIDLPDGWAPEGIAAGKGHELFVGSIPTGRVLRIDARTGEQDEVVPAGEGRQAIGLKADERDRLFVAGGPTGRGFVYDAGTGDELARLQFAPASTSNPPTTFVNDVTLTRDAAYFTDSRAARLYVVDADTLESTVLPVPDIPVNPAVNNLNGIAASPDGKTLLAIQSNTGTLWNIDPESGHAFPVDTGGADLTLGDGILLEGHTLYVVRNRANQIAVLELSKGFTEGALVDTMTSGDFAIPTTVARLGDRLYLPNARFGTPVTPTTDYWVTAVEH